jgi:hypothetical protein
LMTQDIDESIEFANQLATRVVSKRGVSVPWVLKMFIT